MAQRVPHFETGDFGTRMPTVSAEFRQRDRDRMRELDRLIREGKGNVSPERPRIDADDRESIERALRAGMSPREVRLKFRVPLRTVLEIATGQLSLGVG